MKNPVKPPGIDPWTVRLVAQRLNHYATSGSCEKWPIQNFNNHEFKEIEIKAHSFDISVHGRGGGGEREFESYENMNFIFSIRILKVLEITCVFLN